MAEDYKAIIKKTGIIDQKSTYEAVAAFFMDKGFRVTEDKYEHKKGNYKGWNIGHEWQVELKYDKFSRIMFKIKMKLEDAYDVDVSIDGKKYVMTKAYIKLETLGEIEKDYMKKFDSPFRQKLKKILEKVLLRETLEERKKYLIKVGKEFNDLMMEKLELEVNKNE